MQRGTLKLSSGDEFVYLPVFCLFASVFYICSINQSASQPASQHSFIHSFIHSLTHSNIREFRNRSSSSCSNTIPTIHGSNCSSPTISRDLSRSPYGREGGGTPTQYVERGGEGGGSGIVGPTEEISGNRSADDVSSLSSEQLGRSGVGRVRSSYEMRLVLILSLSR